LCFDAGIGVRTGCFCAQRYVRLLLGQKENSEHIDLYEENRMDKIPGMVRVSLAAYNTADEIDYLVEWLKKIMDNKPSFRRRYRFSVVDGTFVPSDLAAVSFIHKIQNQLRG